MGKDLNLVLISRRRFGMAGTRFNARGLDDQGNVANFVETEIILNYDNCKLNFAHVQIRGSVPLFWAQKAKKQKVTLKQNQRLTEIAFNTHMHSIIDQYTRIVFLNLLAHDKPHEKMLSDRITVLFQNAKFDKAKLKNYDFHF